MKKIKLIVTAIIIVASFNANAQLTGTQIVDKAYNRDTGDDQSALLTMTLINSRGDTRIRKIKQFTKDFDEVEKSIMFFTFPADVENTSFMNWSYDSDKSDDQWIYLPALRKTKRISSDSKSDYFMGSDFTYDDLGDRKLNAITWIMKDSFIGYKKEFYDEDDDLLKILSIKGIKDVSSYSIVTNSEMKNVQNGHKTSMVLKNVKVNIGISSAKFSERMMTRGL
jgi:hypothetical protein